MPKYQFKQEMTINTKTCSGCPFHQCDFDYDIESCRMGRNDNLNGVGYRSWEFGKKRPFRCAFVQEVE